MGHCQKVNLNQSIRIESINSSFSLQSEIGARICEYLESIRQTNESGPASIARTPPIQMSSPIGPTIGNASQLQYSLPYR